MQEETRKRIHKQLGELKRMAETARMTSAKELQAWPDEPDYELEEELEEIRAKDRERVLNKVRIIDQQHGHEKHYQLDYIEQTEISMECFSKNKKLICLN